MTMPFGLTSSTLARRGRRVERDQDIRLIGGCVDVDAREMNLKSRHTRHRAGWSADLGWEIREGGQIVSGKGGFRH